MECKEKSLKIKYQQQIFVDVLYAGYASKHFIYSVENTPALQINLGLHPCLSPTRCKLERVT